MASENHIYKLSNAGGFKSLTRYPDMLAGNTVWNPYTPVGSYDSIATVTVPVGGLSSITFAGIPTGYRHLQLRALWRDGSEIIVAYNGDTNSANYWRHYLQGSGSAAQAGGASSNAFYGYSGSGTYYTSSIVDILDYANTTKYKVSRTLWGFDANGSGYIGLTSGNWSNTAAITSITLTNTGATNFPQYSQFALYGVK